MKASELRIGNWYMFADYEGIVCRTIAEIKYNQFGLLSDSDGCNYDICKPIPLTEEWLEKLGFEICGYNQLFWRHNTLIPNFELDGINWADADIPKYQFLTYSFNGEIFLIHYVHQLQNLYFVLTGEELTIKQQEQ